MNVDRRQIGALTIALLVECDRKGTIPDEADTAISTALKHMQQAENWQLKAQEKHAGKNATTDTQIAICQVAIAELKKAVTAWDNDRFDIVIRSLKKAITYDGTPAKEKK